MAFFIVRPAAWAHAVVASDYALKSFAQDVIKITTDPGHEGIAIESCRLYELRVEIAHLQPYPFPTLPREGTGSVLPPSHTELSAANAS